MFKIEKFREEEEKKKKESNIKSCKGKGVLDMHLVVAEKSTVFQCDKIGQSLCLNVIDKAYCIQHR